MTIHGLWEWYKNNVEYDFVLAETFKGKFVGIDTDNAIYKQRCVQLAIYLKNFDPFNDDIDHKAIDKKVLAKIVENLMSKYLKDGMMPIFVFDGDEKDVLKLSTLKNRAEPKKAAKKTYRALRKKYKGKGILQIPSEDLKKGRNCLAIMERMPRASMKLFVQFIKDLGFPWIKAKTEAERVCALINAQGLTCATVSDDGDCLACGGPVVIRGRTTTQKGGMAVGTYKVATLAAFLKALDLKVEKFQELCIMSGTDFNTWVKGTSFKTCKKLIDKHGSIRAYSKATGKDVSCINYKEVRTRFDVVPWKDTVSYYSLTISPKKLKSKLVAKDLIETVVHRMQSWKDKYGDLEVSEASEETLYSVSTSEEASI